MKRFDPANFSDALLYRVAELLFEQRGEGTERLRMKEIAEQLKREFGANLKLSRESINPLIELAVKRKLVRLAPPLSMALRKKIVAKFRGLAEEEVEVVETRGPDDNAKVAAVAAEKALGAMVRIAQLKRGQPVGLGLGPGRATLEFCQYLNTLLPEWHSEDIKVRLVAITAGGPASLLDYTPGSFLKLFPDHLVENRVGLFAETLVPAGELERIRNRTGVKEAFAARDQIDLVVTAMGDFEDPHDLLRVFLKDSGQDVDALRRLGWLGNVQYRPFTAAGPLKEEPGDLRAVTVFELEDLVRMARDRSKEVILMGRQCGLCPQARAGALRALLSNPSLKVFSRLVLDRATALELLKEEARK